MPSFKFESPKTRICSHRAFHFKRLCAESMRVDLYKQRWSTTAFSSPWFFSLLEMIRCLPICVLPHTAIWKEKKQKNYPFDRAKHAAKHTHIFYILFNFNSDCWDKECDAFAMIHHTLIFRVGGSLRKFLEVKEILEALGDTQTQKQEVLSSWLNQNFDFLRWLRDPNLWKMHKT